MERESLCTWTFLACLAVSLAANGTTSSSRQVAGKLETEVLLTLSRASSLTMCHAACRGTTGCKSFNRNVSRISRTFNHQFIILHDHQLIIRSVCESKSKTCCVIYNLVPKTTRNTHNFAFDFLMSKLTKLLLNYL